MVHRMVREGRLHGERQVHKNLIYEDLGKTVPDRGKRKCKGHSGSGQGRGWPVQGTAIYPVWLESGKKRQRWAESRCRTLRAMIKSLDFVLNATGRHRRV